MGHGTKEDVYKPKYLWKLSSEITRIACGWNHSVAVDASNRVWMWGEKDAIGIEADAYEPIVYTEAGNTIQKVKAGNCYTLAISKDNRLFGWGVNEEDRLTSNATNFFTKKVVVQDQDYTKRFQTAACAYNHSAALIKDEQVLVVWGSKYNGKLGIPMLDDQGNVAAGETQGEPLRVLIRLQQDLDVAQELEDEKELPVETTPKPADTAEAPVQTAGDTTASPSLPVTLAVVKRKPLSMKTKCELSFLQSKLKSEKETSKPYTLTAMDVQLRSQMIEVYESFSKMSDVSEDKSFVESLVSKTLVRIQNAPFKMKLESQPVVKAHIRNVKFTYKAIISTLQLHPCYLFNIIKAKYDDFYMNQRILKLVFQGIEGDERLMHSALRCARLILNYELANAATAVEFISNENTLYLVLVQILVGCTTTDIQAVKDITKQVHSTMIAVVGDDVNGLLMPKDMQSIGKDKRRVDGRKNNLIEIMSKIISQLEVWVTSEKGGIKFSEEVRWMFHELRAKFALKVGHSNLLVNEELNPDYFALTKFVLAQTFSHVCSAVEKPTKYFITFESDQTLHQENLTTLSRALSCYFQSKKFDEIPYLETINTIMTKPMTNNDPRLTIFNQLTDNPAFSPAAKMTETIFEHSYRNFDVTVTASVEVLAYIHKVIHTKIDQIALSRNTYDAIRSIDKFAHPPIDPTEDDKLTNLNLRLRTRTVRFQQSLVICNECEMAVAKELASPRFESLLAVYEPLPEDSLVRLIGDILVAGPTAQVKKSLAEFLLFYETSTAATRSKAETERLTQARDLVSQAADIYFASEELRPTPEVVDDYKAKFLANIQDEVTDEYFKRKAHSKLIKLYGEMLIKLSSLAVSSLKEEKQLVVKKREVLYNVEYGASNREVEQYSDSYVYKIFLNEITKYTTSQPMSQDLFETLREDDIKHIKAYGRATYTRLRKQKMLLTFEPMDDLE